MWKKSILSQYNSQNKQSEMDITTSGASSGEGYDSPVFHVPQSKSTVSPTKPSVSAQNIK